MPPLNGTTGNDYIDVTARLGAGVAAMVMAGAGIDRVVGGSGSDTLYGEDGDDQLVGNAGNDWLIGGDGSDKMSGGADADTLDGGIGHDTMGGDAGDDSLAGGLGMDALTGGDGNDTLDGGDDVDSLAGNAGNDLLLAGAGDDRANGGAGNDTVHGGLGADTIDGNLDNDQIHGEDGNDTLAGGDGNDIVDGGIDNDIVMGGAGDDAVTGGDGDDTLEGGLGLDSVDGGSGNDLVKQTVAAAPLAGLDMVDGGSGTDTLHVALTLAQWQTAGIQADLAGLSASFASPLGQTVAYTASSLGFSAVRFENLMISVDGNYAPTAIALSASTIAENVVAGAIGTLTTTDATLADAFTYTVDDNRFEVVSGVLALKAGVALNYEAASSVALNVTSTDGSGLAITRAFTVAVTNVNEAPVVSAAVATKYATAGTATSFDVSTAFSDPDAGDTLTWSATSTLPTGVTFNATTHVFSVASTATAGLTAITIRAQDGAGLFATNTFTLSISDTTTLNGSVLQGNSQNNFLDYRASLGGVNVDTRQGDDTVYGSNFADTLNGGTGNNTDQVYGGAGNDLLTSGSGTDNDIFWYAEANSGNDTITDFTKNGVPPRDRLGFDISETGVDSMAKLAIGTAGGVVVISWGAGTGATGTGSITLSGVTNPALFTTTDFLFVA